MLAVYPSPRPCPDDRYAPQQCSFHMEQITEYLEKTEKKKVHCVAPHVCVTPPCLFLACVCTCITSASPLLPTAFRSPCEYLSLSTTSCVCLSDASAVLKYKSTSLRMSGHRSWSSPCKSIKNSKISTKVVVVIVVGGDHILEREAEGRGGEWQDRRETVRPPSPPSPPSPLSWLLISIPLAIIPVLYGTIAPLFILPLFLASL